jgi:hypothetical protein
MGKHSKPGKAKNVSTSEKAVALIGLNNDLETFEKGEAINPINDGSKGPHTTQAWLPGNGPGRRGVKTEAGVRADLDAARGMGLDPSQAQAVHDNINSGRAFDDRKIPTAPQDRGGDPSRRPAL